MELSIIKTKQQYNSYLTYIDQLFDKKVTKDSKEGEELQILLLLIKQYEDEHNPIPMPDAIEAIKIRMQEMGLKNKDLVGKAGSKGYISSILNKKKPLTLALAKMFHRELGISAEVLLS